MQHSGALAHADPELRADPTLVLMAAREDVGVLQYASSRLLDHRKFLLSAVRQDVVLLQHVRPSLLADRNFMLAAVALDDNALEWISDKLREDRIFILECVRQHATALALRYAAEALRADRDFVHKVVQQNGRALQYASESLQADSGIVRAAIQWGRGIDRPVGEAAEILSMACPPLNQDDEMIRLAGLSLVQSDLPNSRRLPEIVLSVRFSLAQGSSSLASKLYLMIIKHRQFKDMYVHNPNVMRKGFCGLAYTKVLGHEAEKPDYDDDRRPIYGWCRNDDDGWLCSGTCGVECWKRGQDQVHDCRKHDQLRYACWRLVYRRHLDKAKANGLMLQLREGESLGRGQQVELRMARDVGVKVIIMQVDPGLDEFPERCIEVLRHVMNFGIPMRGEGWRIYQHSFSEG